MWRNDLASKASPSQVTQLPVNAYFDEQLLADEQERIFKHAPAYAGHSLLVPELHDYFVLPHRHNGMALIRSAEGVTLMSNVCRHWQATRATATRRACRALCTAGPMQTRVTSSWRHDSRQSLVRSWKPIRFKSGTVCSSQGEIRRQALRTCPSTSSSIWHSMTCTSGIWRFMTARTTGRPSSSFIWRTTTSRLAIQAWGVVSCDELKWAFGEDWSVQTVGFHRDLSQPGDSDVYRAWHGAVLAHYDNKLPSVGAMWFLLYPNVMIEWYPFVTVISTVHPRGPFCLVHRGRQRPGGSARHTGAALCGRVHETHSIPARHRLLWGGHLADVRSRQAT